MNAGLLAARAELVLFVDDDVIPGAGLLAAHRRAHRADGVTVVAGRVVQPWDKSSVTAGRNPFAGERGAWVAEFIGCNFSLRREAALALGGFDEKFVRVAYRFEREFSDRVLAAGGGILFEPGAQLEHLRAGDGGTRAWGDPWSSPGHAVGEYYYLMRSGRVSRRWRGILARPIRAISTRRHLRRPWLVPVTLAVEAAALLWALGLRLGPPRLIAGADRSRRAAGAS
jgi:GT2 family glycosyltransferase